MRWFLIFIVLFFVGCEKKDEIKSLKNEIESLKLEMKMLKTQKNSSDEVKKLSLEIEKIKEALLKTDKAIMELNKSIVYIPSPINCKGYFKPTTFITKKEAKIYNSKGEVVTTWPKCKTFTSYIEKDGKLKITGIFVNLKWQDARAKDWWIDVKDVAKKFKDKNESKNMRDN